MISNERSRGKFSATCFYNSIKKILSYDKHSKNDSFQQFQNFKKN